MASLPKHALLGLNMLLVCVCGCGRTGLAAGALGIAAGTILSPLLLAGGMNALVTVASTGMMVLFTASSTSIQYLILGRLQVALLYILFWLRFS
jgi:uncharacterized membrane protein YfcA